MVGYIVLGFDYDRWRAIEVFKLFTIRFPISYFRDSFSDDVHVHVDTFHHKFFFK